MLEFEDVIKCKTVEELNEFIQKYLDERELERAFQVYTFMMLQNSAII